MEALKGRLKEAEKATLKIRTMKGAFAGSQIATAVMATEAAWRLDMERRIEIGWVRCRVNIQTQITRCYRCWVYGHLAKSCKGVNREALCLNCGEEGHKVKDCQGQSKCPIGRVPEHRVDQMACSKYKAAVDARRKEETGRRKKARGEREPSRPDRSNSGGENTTGDNQRGKESFISSNLTVPCRQRTGRVSFGRFPLPPTKKKGRLS